MNLLASPFRLRPKTPIFSLISGATSRLFVSMDESKTGKKTARSEAYHWAMSRICPEYLDPETSDRSVAADVLVREEPDEEEDGEGDGEEKEGEEEEDDEGYSE